MQGRKCSAECSSSPSTARTENIYKINLTNIVSACRRRRPSLVVSASSSPCSLTSSASSACCPPCSPSGSCVACAPCSGCGSSSSPSPSPCSGCGSSSSPSPSPSPSPSAPSAAPCFWSDSSASAPCSGTGPCALTDSASGIGNGSCYCDFFPRRHRNWILHLCNRWSRGHENLKGIKSGKLVFEGDHSGRDWPVLKFWSSVICII